MIADYRCDCGFSDIVSFGIKQGPPEMVFCVCGKQMQRVWKAPQFICEPADKPADHVPEQFRVSSRVRPESAAKGRRIERAYQADIEHKRQIARGNSGDAPQMSHSIPAHLYHGKIRETGDRNYWLDPKNRNKHKSCEIKKKK